MIVKVCKVHGEIEDKDIYTCKSNTSAKRYPVCRKCQRAWAAGYRRKNKEQCNIRAKESYHRDRDENKCKKKERRRIYRLKNKEKISLHNKRYREKNKDKISSYFKNRIRIRLEHEKIKDRASSRRNVANLTDTYVRCLFYRNIKSVVNIPICLIESKREILKIKRYLKEIKNANKEC